MSGGIQKYPPSGASIPPNFPPVAPSQPSPPRPAPPSPAAPPAGPVIVAGGGAVVNNLDNQINYSNQKVGYFKIDLYNTKSNLYGESIEKWYYPPIQIKCLLERGEFTNTDTEFGVDTTQTLTVTVSKTEFETTYNFTPEVGDIITDQERYYEVSSIDRKFVTLPGTGTSASIIGEPGLIVLYVLSAYLTRTSRLNLVKYSI
jgi:hypothetical protein